jgi:hypothetical protein
LIPATENESALELVVEVNVAVSVLVFLFKEHVSAVQSIQGANPEIVVQVFVAVVVVCDEKS